MKKALSLVLALTLAFALCLTALADVTSPGGTGNTNVSCTVVQTFTVTIPESVTIDPVTMFGRLTVGVAAGSVIPAGTKIVVRLTACAKHLTYAGESIPYSLEPLPYTIEINNKQVEVGEGRNPVLTHAAGNTGGSSAELVLNVFQYPEYPGEYTDTMTFTVTLETTPTPEA